MLSESFLPFFEWCGKTWLGTTVRDTVWAFPVIETFHLLALAVLLGTVLIVNLRYSGWARTRSSYAEMARELEPWMLTSLAVLILSGIPMFLSEPMKCYESYSFPIKMILLVVAILWHFTIQRRWTSPDANRLTPLKGRLAACFSILLWAALASPEREFHMCSIVTAPLWWRLCGIVFVVSGVAYSATDDSRCAGAGDLRLVNGRIVTMDKRNSVVSEVTIQNGQFDAVGPGEQPQAQPVYEGN